MNGIAAQMCGKHLGKIAYVELAKINVARLPPRLYIPKAVLTILRTPVRSGRVGLFRRAVRPV